MRTRKPEIEPQAEADGSHDSHGEKRGVVRELHVGRPGRPSPEADAALVAEVLAGSRAAAATMVDRYGQQVERLLWSLLGPEPEVEDLLHEVFVRALEGIADLEDPSRLRSWLTGIGVRTAHEHIRRRVRRRWLVFVEEVPERASLAADEVVTEATRSTYEVLRGMPVEERVIFSLRFIEGLELTEVAEACDVSLSTAKRRLKDAEKHFVARARSKPALKSWLEEGGRWATA